MGCVNTFLSLRANFVGKRKGVDFGSLHLYVEKLVTLSGCDMLTKIISGAQTGVDRAALDVARAKKFPCGGWCPKGRLAEDGKLPKSYPLEESKSSDERIATELNILEADGTLILTLGRPTGGTALAGELARRRGKPYLVIDLLEVVDTNTASTLIRNWLRENKIEILSISGPRQSRCPGIYESTKAILEKVIG